MKKVSLSETLTQLPFPPTDKWPQGVWHSLVLRHGTMSTGVFAPKGKDFQGPHPQDEVYFVARGHGEIIMDGERTACQVGDALFVPANAVHHFENFSDDFVTWVIFWGPEVLREGGVGKYPAILPSLVDSFAPSPRPSPARAGALNLGKAVIARSVSDEAIPAENKDCFAALAMTLRLNLIGITLVSTHARDAGVCQVCCRCTCRLQRSAHHSR